MPYPCSRQILKLKIKTIHVNIVMRNKVIQEVKSWERKRRRMMMG